ncbi:MAG: hypothetical protein EON61_18310 [Alphaproteobacteria bacterium]|jgi:hypothetical protein|nr:MAG: hypothetical protein EON61_18310 [Alphaproteobacteria bacterium]
MTPTPDLSDAQKKGQKLFMTGAGLVMGGLIMGGGLAMVFYFLSIRMGAMVSILFGVAAILVGIWLQMRGAKLLSSKSPFKGGQ